MHAGGSLIASVCSGSLMLAEAGLLDGRRAGCHWAYRDLFREHYPRVELAEDSILDLTSEPDGVITAGGVTAWQDLALHLIARLCGPAHALQTSKVFLLAGHEDGQRPFSAMTRPRQVSDAVIGQCQAWIGGQLRQSPTRWPPWRSGPGSRRAPSDVASGAATGYRPIEYVHALRIEEARRHHRDRDPAASTTSATPWATRTRPSSAACSGARPGSARPPTGGRWRASSIRPELGSYQSTTAVMVSVALATSRSAHPSTARRDPANRRVPGPL